MEGFWTKQPVQKSNEIIQIEKEIIKIDLENINSLANELPEGYEWQTYDIEKDTDCKRIARYLEKNYKKEKYTKFETKYNNEYIRWILKTPKYKPDYCVGIVSSVNKKLVGFVSGTPKTYQLNKNKLNIIEINFLCTDLEHREKKLTHYLIDELKRRCYINGYTQGFYTLNQELNKEELGSLCKIEYYYRAINVSKLLNSKFWELQNDENNKHNRLEMEKYYELPNKTKKTFIEMEEKHLPGVYKAFNTYIEKYNFHPIFTKEEFEQKFWNNFVKVYVLLNENNEVEDFASYYKLPYEKVLSNNKKYKYINNGYLYYYTSNKETSYKMIMNLMISSKNDIDILNGTNVLENEIMLKELGFTEGNKSIDYKFYNWNHKILKCNQIGSINY